MIENLEALRTLYPQPSERAVRKQLDRLDAHCHRFIGLSPFLVLASAGADGDLDASPRGGEPGFVRVANDRTLLVPDSPGNNRLDTLTNILERGRVGILFLIPGVDETLRVNGTARLTDSAQALAHFEGERRSPKLAIEVSVREAYLHCAKSLMRAKLWSPDSRIERVRLPTMNQMIHDQIGSADAPESQEAMLARYAADL